MLYQIVEEKYKNARYNAGSKARQDAETLLSELGFSPVHMTPHSEGRSTAGKIGKILGHLKSALDWNRTIKQMGKGDVLFLQLPLINHTILIDKAFDSAKKRGLKVIALVHDLEELRLSLSDVSETEKERYCREGRAQRQLADVIIAHTPAMKEYMVTELSVPEEKIVVLGIFDYLLEKNNPYAECTGDGIVIAGNLSLEKAAYLYDLPEKPVFNLYGKGLDEKSAMSRKNLVYKGVFSPDEPAGLSGKYGLVWDGESSQTCWGRFGSYLTYNSPHKTSLYLACGLPVIIWDKAALAPLIREEGVGLTISNLKDAEAMIKTVTGEEYESMRQKSRQLAEKLRCGFFLHEAIIEALDCIGDVFNN